MMTTIFVGPFALAGVVVAWATVGYDRRRRAQKDQEQDTIENEGEQ